MALQLHTTIGIIIKLNDAKEADRIVHVLTSKGEREVIVAKGVKKQGSRKAHAIDLLNLVEYKTVEAGQLPMLSEIKLISANLQFKNNYLGLIFVQLLCEVTNTLLQEGQIEIGYYNNLINLCQLADTKNIYLIAAAYILRCLYLSGGLPDLNEDLSDGERFTQEGKRYLTSAPGYVSEPMYADSTAVSDRLIKSQKFILQHDFAATQRLSLSEDEQKQLLMIHVGWYQIVTEKELRSIKLFLK